jgi:hypothetical protein
MCCRNEDEHPQRPRSDTGVVLATIVTVLFVTRMQPLFLVCILLRCPFESAKKRWTAMGTVKTRRSGTELGI